DLRLGVGYNFTKAEEQANRSAFGLSKRGVYFVISSKLSNIFNLFGTSREGLVAMDDAQTHEYLAQNFDPKKEQAKNNSQSLAKPVTKTAKSQHAITTPDNQAPLQQQPLETITAIAEQQPQAPIKLAKTPEPILSESDEPVTTTSAVPERPAVASITATNTATSNHQPLVNQRISDVVYTVQIGSHQRLADARRHAAYLQRFGIATRIVRAGIPGRGTWYRVQSGQFNTLDDAGNYGERLKTQGALVNFVIADFQTTDPIN
ncbi:MAG TPA: SPOR domain-containing protein, partial [Blastocatellia bacterium]|nr:SPOR domain-containing protein [Blastocatellia bacterium]